LIFEIEYWIPACAGMTRMGKNSKSKAPSTKQIQKDKNGKFKTIWIPAFAGMTSNIHLAMLGGCHPFNYFRFSIFNFQFLPLP
jgi:hypothetical protein